MQKKLNHNLWKTLCEMLKNHFVLFLIFKICLLFFSNNSFAESKSTLNTSSNITNKNPYPSKLVSSTDELSTIKSVALIPLFDNTNGIYKSKVEAALVDHMLKDPFWSVISIITENEGVQKILKEIKIDQIDNDPNYSLKKIQEIKTDSLLVVYINKGALGLNIELNLYTKDQGYLLLKESYLDKNLFEINAVVKKVIELYEQLKMNLPFSGYVTSRSGSKVTLGIGKNQKLKVGDEVSIVQILKINRHPKTKMMISAEKEIIGKAKVNQVEESTSYADLTYEKEMGVVQKNHKILNPNGIKYENPLAEQPKLPLENNPDEWLPTPKPQFGKITILGGFAQAKENTVLVTGQNISASSAFALTFDFNAELWITPEFFTNVGFNQLTFSDKNNLSGSSPSDLNFNRNTMELLGGYKDLIDGQFWGPQVKFSLGYFSVVNNVTDSTPTAFTSTQLTSWVFNLAGEFPVTLKRDLIFGAQAQFSFNEKLSEKPVSSGDAGTDLTHFKIYSTYQYTNNINLKGLIDIQSIKTQFSGSGSKSPKSRSIDENLTSYLVGIEYMF